jgi:Bacterial Ig-like domain
MKRRAILALALALALVVFVLLLSEENGKQTSEATQGKPFTGDSGVIRSVAWIRQRQQYLDRHPELAKQNAQAAQEAAAEEAAREEATGEKAAGGGEPDTNIREKPEPGEEGMPQKSPGPAARQQHTGKSAIAQASNLTADTSFLGAESSESGFIPPDSMGSVGPSQVLVFVNGRIKVFDKNGNPGSSLNVDDSTFWAPVSNGSEPTDPGVEYDRLSGRWIVSGINTENSNNRVMVAVSSGPTITNTSSFSYFFFNEASPAPSGPARFVDYPQLGVDASAIYIGVNEFANATSGGFTGTDAFVIRKSSVLGGGPIVVTAFRNLVASTGTGPGPDSPQPATTMDPSVNEGYIVGPDNQFFSRIVVRRITDPGGTPSISGNLNVTVPTTTLPINVPQQGSGSTLDPLDDRLFEAMIARVPDGSDALWTAHNIRLDSSGTGSSSGDRDGGRWYQLGTLSTTPSLIQSGTLFDPAATNPRFFWMPSIAANGQGHASLNSSAAGSTHHPEIASTGRLATDPTGTTEPFDITQTSTFTYALGSGQPKRWGDYSQTVVDPTDNQTFWTFQEYANANNSWGVQVIKLLAPPPATPATANPSSMPLGQCSVSVQLTGTSVNGSGFFDPGPDPGGPGYQNHISAQVTGGVAINSVTFTDRTHVTLDLDTRNATAGVQNVTVTNPDGQSDTGTGILTTTASGASPTPPCLNGTVPASPANNNSPKVFGTAEAGTTVRLYTDSGCAGTPVGSGTAAEFAFPGIPVDSPPVSDNSTTTFYADATDGTNTSLCSSSLDSASKSVSYVEDSTAPTVTIDSGPSASTTDTTPTFGFSADDPFPPGDTITFQCSIDTGTASFAACSGPGNTDTPGSPLADGSYTFRVQGTDVAGNSAVATRSFTVAMPKPGSPPPDTTITKGPKKTQKTRPKFRFTSSDPGASFQCKLDRGPFAPCTSPFRTPRLRPGKHKLKVMAVNSAGADTTPAVRKFRVLPPS